MQYEKEVMPSYQWKLEKFLLVYLIVLIGGAIVALVGGLLIGFLITDEGVICFIPEFVWMGVVAVMSVVLVVKARHVKIQLRVDIAEKLTSEFYAVDYQEAKRKLIEQNIITDEGFINNNDESYETLIFPCDDVKDGIECKIIPFEKAKIIFDATCLNGKPLLNVYVQCEQDSWEYPCFDNYFYNFLINNPNLISNKKVFELFRDDKQKFARLLVRYNDVTKIEKVI